MYTPATGDSLRRMAVMSATHSGIAQIYTIITSGRADCHLLTNSRRLQQNIVFNDRLNPWAMAAFPRPDPVDTEVACELVPEGTGGDAGQSAWRARTLRVSGTTDDDQPALVAPSAAEIIRKCTEQELHRQGATSA